VRGHLLEINSSNNNSLIQNLVDKFRDAFNSHNAERLGSLLAEDGEWTDVIGHTMIEKEEIEHQHTYPFTTVLKEAKLDVKSHRSKWITDEIVSIDIKWESSGHRTPEEKPIPTIRLTQSYCKKDECKRKRRYNIKNNYCTQ
jgi:uncharacterized protein (TIGR02246 family)